MSQSPQDVKDYSQEKKYTHHNGVKSWYGDIVDQQCREQPMYCWPGEAGANEGALVGERRNVQKGP